MFPLGVRGRTWFRFSQNVVPDVLKLFENQFFHTPPKTKIWIPEVQQMSKCSKVFQNDSHVLLRVAYVSLLFFLLRLQFILSLIMIIFFHVLYYSFRYLDFL